MDRTYFERRRATIIVRNTIEMPGDAGTGVAMRALLFTGCVVVLQTAFVLYEHREYWGLTARTLLADAVEIVNQAADALRPLLEGRES